MEHSVMTYETCYQSFRFAQEVSGSIHHLAIGLKLAPWDLTMRSQQAFFQCGKVKAIFQIICRTIFLPDRILSSVSEVRAGRFEIEQPILNHGLYIYARVSEPLLGGGDKPNILHLAPFISLLPTCHHQGLNFMALDPTPWRGHD